MVWFSAEQTASIVTIQQLITAWATDLDKTGGAHLGPLLTDDTAYRCRADIRHGRDAVEDFYRQRGLEMGATSPTMRHVVSNFLVTFGADDTARVDFLLTYYFSLSAAPVTDFTGPLALADVWMDVARGADGHWRIASFDSVQSFVRKPA